MFWKRPTEPETPPLPLARVAVEGHTDTKYFFVTNVLVQDGNLLLFNKGGLCLVAAFACGEWKCVAPAQNDTENTGYQEVKNG